MAPRGFNISAPWRHWPDRDVSRRIPGQTLRHCHDACIAPDHGAQEQGGSRAPAQSPALRTLRRDAASGNGPAGAYAAWALLGGLGRPGWSGMYSQNPEGGKPDWRFSSGRGMRRVAAVGPARQGVRSSSAVAPCGLRKAGQGPGRQAQGCAAQGGGRAERNRSWSVLFWSGRFRPVVLVLLSGMPWALRGMWIRAYARLPVMDAAVAIGLAFECVPDPGWLSAVVCAKPRAFAMCFCHQPARRRFCAASFVLCLCLGRMPGIQCPGSGPAGCLFI